jgi:hypothetical protein
VIHAWAEADRNPRLRDMLDRLFEQQRGLAARCGLTPPRPSRIGIIRA